MNIYSRNGGHSAPRAFGWGGKNRGAWWPSICNSLSREYRLAVFIARRWKGKVVSDVALTETRFSQEKVLKFHKMA